jgi:hypothetical protein
LDTKSKKLVRIKTQNLQSRGLTLIEEPLLFELPKISKHDAKIIEKHLLRTMGKYHHPFLLSKIIC